MNPPSTLAPDAALNLAPIAPAPSAPTRPFYWSVRRELWENRSLYIAPLVVTAFVLLGSLISLFDLPRRLQALPALDLAARRAMLVQPFSMAPAPIMLATLLVGVFYALDALYGERRDRSILFWKSLPVSDRTTVLSKAAIPMLVLPAIAFALSVATVFAMLLLGTAILAANGIGAAPLWADSWLVQQPLIMIYGLAVHALWFAPIYGWLLLVSAWARRTPVLWAALPLAAIALEKIAANSSHVGLLLKYRVVGAMAEAFAGTRPEAAAGNIDHLWQLTPARFLSAPGLWLGLLFAAVCLAAAVRLRRNREPI
jgi:ABC-2 type transport system permease protein